MKSYPGDFHGLPPATEQIVLLQLPNLASTYVSAHLHLLMFCIELWH